MGIRSLRLHTKTLMALVALIGFLAAGFVFHNRRVELQRKAEYHARQADAWEIECGQWEPLKNGMTVGLAGFKFASFADDIGRFLDPGDKSDRKTSEAAKKAEIEAYKRGLANLESEIALARQMSRLHRDLSIKCKIAASHPWKQVDIEDRLAVPTSVEEPPPGDRGFAPLIARYEGVLRLYPDSAETCYTLARLLSTAPDKKCRDGKLRRDTRHARL